MEGKMEKAIEVFAQLCAMLDSRGWHYERIDDDLVIKSGVKGEDLPIEFIMRVNPHNQIISFFSAMPFEVGEEKRVDMAVAVCAANYGLVDGSFDYNISNGQIVFRLTASYRDSQLSDELLEYMIIVSAQTIDQYNDKFFMIAKNMLSIQDFLNSESEG